MRKTLNGIDQRVWELHLAGRSVSQIARAEQLGDEYVRSVVTGVWRDDKAAMKNAA